MSNRTLADEIITLIKSEANNNPPPKACKIIANYGDKPYSDVEVEDLGKLTYIKTIGITEIGSEGIICFLDGDLNNGVVLTSSVINQYFSIEGVNLSDFVRKEDVSFDVGLMYDGYMCFDLLLERGD